jgi:hypothetical protein
MVRIIFKTLVSGSGSAILPVFMQYTIVA